MNILNLKLKGKDKTIIEWNINAFKSKLNLWMTQIKGDNFGHFTNLEYHVKYHDKNDTNKYLESLAEPKLFLFTWN